MDGDCDGDGIKAELDGNNEVDFGIRTAIPGTSRTTYLSIKSIVLRQYRERAIVTYNVTGDETADAYQTWDEMEVYDIGDGENGDNGFDSRGRYITLTSSYFEGIDEDAIYHKGKYFRADNNTVRDFSRATTGGDGLQLSGEADGYWVSNFDCVHQRNTKQCFIASVLSDTGANGIYEDFNTICLIGATVTNCNFVTGDGAKIRRGYSVGGAYGVAVEGTANAVNMTLSGLIVTDATLDNIGIFTNTGGGNVTVANTTTARAGRHNINASTADTATFRNNATIGATSCGINRAASGQTETHTASNGNGIAFCVNGSTTAAGAGAVTAAPKLLGGSSPTTAEGFRPNAGSPLIRAGTPTSAKYDYRGRRFNVPPSIGAYELPAVTAPDALYSPASYP